MVPPHNWQNDINGQPEARADLTRFAALSIAGALLTIGMKFGAYLLTGSVGLYSDALEGVVNLVAAIGALVALRFAAQPPDAEHLYGHDKAEYFSSGAEGMLILVAAVGIVSVSVQRLLNPQPIEQIDIGLAISLLAGGINFVVAQTLRRAGKRYESITLEADSSHLMSDVWTSVGVAVGVGAAVLTGLEWLDPVIGLLVALNILREGVSLVRRSVMGLLDTSLPEEDLAKIMEIVDRFEREHDIHTHELRTRQAASRRFVEMHVLVPGEWTVQRGHDVLEELEVEICAVLSRTMVSTHLEPLEDPASWDHSKHSTRPLTPPAEKG